MCSKCQATTSRDLGVYGGRPATKVAPSCLVALLKIPENPPAIQLCTSIMEGVKPSLASEKNRFLEEVETSIRKYIISTGKNCIAINQMKNDNTIYITWYLNDLDSYAKVLYHFLKNKKSAHLQRLQTRLGPLQTHRGHRHRPLDRPLRLPRRRHQRRHHQIPRRRRSQTQALPHPHLRGRTIQRISQSPQQDHRPKSPTRSSIASSTAR